MPISACAKAGAEQLRRRQSVQGATNQAGFTLLEILVVVFLMVAISTVVVVAALRGGGQDASAKALAELSDTVVLMTEQSLFRGDLLAMRFTDTGWEPLRFDVTEAGFLPLPAPLQAVTLPDNIRLEWQLEQDEDDRGPTIAEAAEALTAEDISPDEKPKPPQMFFFPSGEASPVTIRLIDEDTDVRRQLTVDALGVVSIAEDEQP
jgi:general secretion pathway protein H